MANKTQQPTKINKKKIYYVIFVLAWAGLALTASQLIIAYPMAWVLGNKFTQPLWLLIYYVLSYTAALGLIIYLPPKLYRQISQHKTKLKSTELEKDFQTSANELGLQHLPTFVDIGLAPIGYIVYIFAANIITKIMTVFPWFQADQAQVTGFGYFVTTGDRVLAMLALVLVAPIAEEIIMRGWVYGKLRNKLKAPLAILLVSALFGLLHGQWNVGVSVFVLSVVLCSLREITGTIWSGTLLHIISNGIAFYILYVAGF